MDKTSTYQSYIRHIISEILTEEVPGKLLHLTDLLFEALIEIVHPVVPINPHQKDSILQSGKALSPYWAATSIKEFKRTQCFMKGLLEAVNDFHNKYPRECLHIIYAGTGPFAVLALPVMFAYPAGEVKFTFIDIHPDATRALTYLLEKLELNDHIENIFCEDATKFNLPTDPKAHLVLTETMQRALVREPQVAITLHLAPQTDPGTIWIPSSIHVEATLVNKSKDMDRMMGRLGDGDSCLYNLGTLLDLTKTCAQAIVQNNDSLPSTLDEVTFALPPDLVSDYQVLTLMTTVHVYGSHRLFPYESSITLPQELQDLSLLENTPTSVYISYRLGDDPGYESRFE